MVHWLVTTKLNRRQSILYIALIDRVKVTSVFMQYSSLGDCHHCQSLATRCFYGPLTSIRNFSCSYSTVAPTPSKNLEQLMTFYRQISFRNQNLLNPFIIPLILKLHYLFPYILSHIRHRDASICTSGDGRNKHTLMLSLTYWHFSLKIWSKKTGIKKVRIQTDLTKISKWMKIMQKKKLIDKEIKSNKFRNFERK